MDLLEEMLAPKTATVKEKKNKKRGFIESPILYKSKGAIEYSFILDTYPEEYKLKQICTYIESRGLKNNYQVLYPLKIKAKKKDFTEGDTIVKFIKSNMFNLHEYIPEWSKVMTFGRMLYVMTESNQINLEAFYDTIMFNTSIFIPDYKCQIFPTETYDRSFFSSTFENYFTKIQFEIMDEFDISPRELKPKNVVYVDNPSKFFKEHLGEMILSTDIETDGFEWLFDKIGSVQFAFDSNTGYFLNWDDINTDELNEFLKDKKIIGQNIKFDGKFLIRNGVKKENFKVLADTMNMSHCINEMRKANLKGLCAFYTDHFGYDKELEAFKEQFPDISYIDMPFDLKVKYGGYDPAVTLEIYEKMLDEIRRIDKEYPLENGNTLESYFFNEIMPTVNSHLDSEMRGVDINVEELYRNSIFFHKKIQELKKEVRTALHITDPTINLSSNPQLAEVVKNLGWKDQGLNKDGSYTMNDESLTKFIEDGHKEAKLIQDLHSLETLMNTFVGYPIFKGQEMSFDLDSFLDEALENDTSMFDDFEFPERFNISEVELGKGTGYWQHLKKIGRGTYKVFPRFGTCMAQSHRNKHMKPNLANIPVRGDYAKRIRRIYTPPTKDHVWVSADQSGVQLRAIAFLLEEGSPMRTAFLELGGDLHSMTGATVINNNKIPLEEFIKLRHQGDEFIINQRYKAKGQNFGLAFGAGEFTVKTTTIEPNWSEKECVDFIIENGLDIVNGDVYLTVAREMIVRHFKQYYGLKKWIENTKKFARKNGFVRSPFATFRRLPYLLVKPEKNNKLDIKRYSGQENISLNSPIQTIETVIMNRTLNRTNEDCRRLGIDAYIPDFIHDAVECISNKKDLKKFCTIIKEHAETTFPEFNGIPLEMEGNTADYWGTVRRTKIKDGKEVDDWEVWDCGHDWSKYIIQKEKGE